MSKFKVGDRVRAPKWPEYGEMIITESGEKDGIWIGKSSYGSGGFGTKDLELVEETPPIPAPIAERMRGLIERMVPTPQSRVDIDAAYKEARAIMAELVPVDPDLIIARDDEARASEANGFHGYAAQTRKGEHDEGPVRHRYEGIKRGRELEQEGRK